MYENKLNVIEESGNKIAAVIITFNRINFLKEIISAIRKQTLKPDAIIVVNNASSDGTIEWLSNQKDLIIINQDNVGSSGGQFTGIKSAYDNGYNWIWTMDDDIVPEIDCLQNLMIKNDKFIIRTPLRYDPELNPYLNDTISYDLTNPFKSFWKKLISPDDLEKEEIDAVGITFEGPIFNRILVEKIGLPIKKLFIFGDDTDYFLRAYKAGFKIKVITKAKMYRKLPGDQNLKIFTWKHYYIIRNMILLQVIHGNEIVKIIRPWFYLLKWLFRCSTFENIKTTLKAFIDGYFKYSKIIQD